MVERRGFQNPPAARRGSSSLPTPHQLSFKPHDDCLAPPLQAAAFLLLLRIKKKPHENARLSNLWHGAGCRQSGAGGLTLFRGFLDSPSWTLPAWRRGPVRGLARLSASATMAAIGLQRVVLTLHGALRNAHPISMAIVLVDDVAPPDPAQRRFRRTFNPRTRPMTRTVPPDDIICHDLSTDGGQFFADGQQMGADVPGHLTIPSTTNITGWS